MRMSRRNLTEADQIELLSELASAPHCLVPLRATRPDGSGFLIGRSPAAEICLSDPSVSAEHARFYLDDEGAKMIDVGSKNGTTLNGRRVDPGEVPWLQPMDRLTFGRVQAFACDPRVLRGVLRQDLKTLI
jgi:pSer/pThr/pTyr-binding forkhead associated (FHA) protein